MKHTEEKTFVAIKPDAVKRGFIGEIIARFEKKGYKIVGMKMLLVDEELAAKLKTKFFETSALTNYQIQDVFTTLVRDIRDLSKPQKTEEAKPQPQKTSGGGCCLLI